MDWKKDNRARYGWRFFFFISLLILLKLI